MSETLNVEPVEGLIDEIYAESDRLRSLAVRSMFLPEHPPVSDTDAAPIDSNLPASLDVNDDIDVFKMWRDAMVKNIVDASVYEGDESSLIAGLKTPTEATNTKDGNDTPRLFNPITEADDDLLVTDNMWDKGFSVIHPKSDAEIDMELKALLDAAEKDLKVLPESPSTQEPESVTGLSIQEPESVTGLSIQEIRKRLKFPPPITTEAQRARDLKEFLRIQAENEEAWRKQELERVIRNKTLIKVGKIAVSTIVGGIFAVNGIINMFHGTPSAANTDTRELARETSKTLALAPQLAFGMQDRISPQPFILSLAEAAPSVTDPARPIKIASKNIQTPSSKPEVIKPQPNQGIDKWTVLADCETGDHVIGAPFSAQWEYDGKSGYDGGIQFDPDTWDTVRKKLNLPYEFAHQAPVSVQKQAGEYLLAEYGPDQWPNCNRMMQRAGYSL